MTGRRSIFVLGVLTMTTSVPARGPVWDESASGGDAGSTPSSAQTTTGQGVLMRVKGEVTGAAALVGVDLEDMYLIRICDPESFRASTFFAEGGSADFDTRLWLFRFDPEAPANARGVVANDNRPGGPATLLSFINSAPSDGSPPLEDPGLYYLAISGTPRDPRSAPGPAGEIFSLASMTEISGPDGPGGGDPIMGWQTVEPPAAFGAYEIALAGVTFGSTASVDCNRNGRVDACDILAGSSMDVNGNGTPDECEPPADLDGDGDVDFADLLILLSAWGPCRGSAAAACPADLTGDGVVGFSDLLVLLSTWT
jgi:hypothetical protein